MTSQVLSNHIEASYITVESASFYGVTEKPSRVLVNSQDAPFTYRKNQVRFWVMWGLFLFLGLEKENSDTS